MSIQRLHYSSSIRLIIGICAAIIVVICAVILFLQSCPPKWQVSVELIKGSPQVQNAADTVWRPVKLHDVYCKGDKLKVGEDSEVHLKLPDTNNVIISDTIWTVNSHYIDKARQSNGIIVDVGRLSAFVFIGLVILLGFFNVYRHIPQRFLRVIEYLGNVDTARKS